MEGRQSSTIINDIHPTPITILSLDVQVVNMPAAVSPTKKEHSLHCRILCGHTRERADEDVSFSCAGGGGTASAAGAQDLV
jgi:hypothetical protein